MIRVLLTMLPIVAFASDADPVPDYASMLTHESLKQTLGEKGSTAPIEALKGDGNASLYTPGRNEVNRCNSLTTPHCQAVQVVDRVGSRPVVDPDVSGELTQRLESVKDNAAGIFPPETIVTSSEHCQPVKETLSSDPEIKTCDKKTALESVNSSEDFPCETSFRMILEYASRWSCLVDHVKTWITDVSVPMVVPVIKTSVLSCYEGRTSVTTATCPVKTGTNSTLKYAALCLEPKYKERTVTCRRRLAVKTLGTCTPGARVSDSIRDTGVLSSDAVPGFDTLRLSYVCQGNGATSYRIATNTKTGGETDYEEEITDDEAHAVVLRNGGEILFDAIKTCRTNKCEATVTMTVYVDQGKNRVYSGAIKKTFAYQVYSQTSQTDYWEETCQ